MYVTKQKCERCGASLIFQRTEKTGTLVEHNKDHHKILTNAIMSFDWVYFRCSRGCDWQLCTTSDSRDVKPVRFIGASEEQPSWWRRLVRKVNK